MKICRYIPPDDVDVQSEAELFEIMEIMGAQLVIQYDNVDDLNVEKVLNVIHSKLEH